METFSNIIVVIITQLSPLIIVAVIFFVIRKRFRTLLTLSKSNYKDLEKIFNTLENKSTTKDTFQIFKANFDEDNNQTEPLVVNTPTRLEKRKKYLHIALNNSLEEAYDILSKIPKSDRILVEVGTPLIKVYGNEAITKIKNYLPSGTYIVADNKCTDMAKREVELCASAGANAATCLGVAPIETIDLFIEECEKRGIDSMVDMMNVENAGLVLKKLKKLPKVVILHRGVDESEFSKDKQIPYYQIKQIKGSYNIMVAVAGGDTIKEVQRAIFNDADIVVVWKDFYSASSDTASLAESFLREI